MKKLLCLMLFILAFQEYAQKIDTWERRYGDEKKEIGNQIVRMNDGNFLINAKKVVDDYGHANLIWLIAVNENGDSIWTKVIGDSAMSSYINDIEISSYGEIFSAYGDDWGGGLGQQAYISKKTDNYKEVWTKTYTSYPSLGVGIKEVTCSSDSGCVVSGAYLENFETSIGFIEKIDKNGKSIAYRQLENSHMDTLYQPTNHIEDLISRKGLFGEEYIAVGNITTMKYLFPYITVFKDSLQTLLETVFEDKDFIFTGIDTVNSMYVISGYSKMFNLDYSLRYSTWSTELSPSIHSVKQTTNEDFFVGTTSKTYKLNKDAEIIWEKDFGSNSLVLTDDGGCLAVGTKFNDVWVCKFDQDGNYTNIYDYVYPETVELYQNYPNPFNPETQISYSLKSEGLVTLSVFNTKGELVNTLVNEKKTAGNHSIDFNAEGLNSGIYFYKLSVDGKNIDSKRMLMIK